MNRTDKYHTHLHLAQGISRLDLNNKFDLLEFWTLLEQQQGRITYRNNFFIQHMLRWLNSRITYLNRRQEEQFNNMPDDRTDSEPNNSEEGIGTKLD